MVTEGAVQCTYPLRPIGLPLNGLSAIAVWSVMQLDWMPTQVKWAMGLAELKHKEENILLYRNSNANK